MAKKKSEGKEVSKTKIKGKKEDALNKIKVFGDQIASEIETEGSPHFEMPTRTKSNVLFNEKDKVV